MFLGESKSTLFGLLKVDAQIRTSGLCCSVVSNLNDS